MAVFVDGEWLLLSMVGVTKISIASLAPGINDGPDGGVATVDGVGETEDAIGGRGGGGGGGG